MDQMFELELIKLTGEKFKNEIKSLMIWKLREHKLIGDGRLEKLANKAENSRTYRCLEKKTYFYLNRNTESSRNEVYDGRWDKRS